MRQSSRIFTAAPATLQRLFIKGDFTTTTCLQYCKQATYNAIIFIFFLFCSASLSAQYTDHRNRKVDSLEQVLKINPPTEKKELAQIYRTLAWGLSQINREQSMDYARKCIEICIPLDGWMAVEECYRLLGIHYHNITQYDSALIYYDKALDATERMRDLPKKYSEKAVEDNLSLLYGSIGNLYNIQGQSVQAIEWYGKALKIFEKYGWKESITYAYRNIGEMYLNMDNYEQAEFNYTKALDYARQTSDSLMVAEVMKSFCQIRTVHHKDYEKALAYADSAYAYYSVHPEETGNKALVLMYKGDICLNGKNDNRQAETYAREALQIADTLDMPREKSQILELFTSIYMHRNEWRKAGQTAVEALAVDSTEPSNTMALYKDLVNIHAYSGNPQKAAEYLEKYDALKSEYSNKHFQSSLSEMEVKYETEKKEMQIATLQEEKRLMVWLGIAGGAVLLLALATFFFLWRWTVQKKRLAESQRELAEQGKQFAEQQIKQLEQEKQLIATQAVLDGEVQERIRLARDLHDSLGSILAAAKYNLLGIKQISLLGEDEQGCYNKTVSLLDDSMNEMRRVAHHLMPEALGSVGLKQSITDFCNSVSIVKFSYYGDDTHLNTNLEIMVYRILHELVTNAMKHAKAEHILVQIVRDADKIYLTVQDDGCGFDTSTESKGMGLRNIQARVTANGGDLLIDSTPGKGTEVNIEIPVD